MDRLCLGETIFLVESPKQFLAKVTDLHNKYKLRGNNESKRSRLKKGHVPPT